MADTPTTVADVAGAANWNERVARVRLVPEQFGRARLREVYAEIARHVYVPDLTTEFATIAWPESMTEATFLAAYKAAVAGTSGFIDIGPATLADVIENDPRTLRVFRLIVGFTRDEFAECTKHVVTPGDLTLSRAVVDTMEAGGRPRRLGDAAEVAAVTIDAVLSGELFPPLPPGPLRTRQQKADTEGGWESVQRFAAEGVPYWVLLHQRLYGGAFRQLSDASSQVVGGGLEEATAALLDSVDVSYIRTGSSGVDKAEVARQFGIRLDFVPDFVVHASGRLEAFLECKNIADGGTARDKAARFARYRDEGQRLGGVPVFAVLAGRGWRRVNDALGPVVAACDGRVFTEVTLPEILTVDPLPRLRQP